MNVLGSSDQKYIFAAGSQSLPEAIAAALPAGSILLDRKLLAIGRQANGVYMLTFSSGGKTEKVYADRVVLAIPFIALRGVDYSSAGFDAAKRRAIENLGYGYHTKLHLQFDRRVVDAQRRVARTDERTDLDDAAGTKCVGFLARASRIATGSSRCSPPDRRR